MPFNHGIIPLPSASYVCPHIVPLPLPRTDPRGSPGRSPALFHTAILLFLGANKAAALSPFPNGAVVAHMNL